jgi:hypothetical protein
MHVPHMNRGRALLACIALTASLELARAGLAAQGSPDVKSSEVPALDLAALRAEPTDIEAHLAHALWEAHAGHFGSAVGRLDALLSSSRAGVERARRERERIAALQVARDGRLAAAAATGARITIHRGSDQAIVKVLAFVDGTVKLASNRFSLESISADELSCAELLKLEKNVPIRSPKWVRAYAMLLERDQDWQSALTDEGGEDDLVRSLPADAEGLDQVLRLGHAVSELEKLSRFPIHAANALAVDETQAAIDGLRGLLAESSDLPFVASRHEQLRGLALAALGARFDADPGLPGLRGKTQRLENGAVRISYAFDDPEDIKDFALVPGALPEWHNSIQPVEKSMAESNLIVSQGAFSGEGQVTYRHVLDFVAPIRVRYSIRYVAREGDPIDLGVVMIGLAWDGDSSFASATDFGDVYLGRGVRALYEGKRAVNVGESYEVEARLATDGREASIQSWRGGEQRKQLSAGPLRKGGLFLFVHSPHVVAIESMEIEGRLETIVLKTLRERWIAAQLAEMKL